MFLGVFDHVIEEAAGFLGAVWRRDRADHAAMLHDRIEDRKLASGPDIAHIGDDERVAKIRLIRSRI